MSEAAICRRPGGLELTARLLAEAAPPAGAAVLDVGCGAGATVAYLADDLDLPATGLDASAGAVSSASRARPDLRFVCGRAEALPFPGASFDAVLCECVLSTLPDPGVALREMARVLRPSGIALASDVYVRAGREAARGGGVPALGSRKTVESLFRAAELPVTAWSDESGALARYVWEHAGRRDGPVPPPSMRTHAGGRRLGYFICTAQPAPAAAKGASHA